MSKILVSAGHQIGLDSGAVGQGQYEANDNVRMCDRIVYYLKAWGIETIYMPNNVGDLQAEINWANANLKLYEGYAIQVHRNAGGGTGNEVWTTNFEAQIALATAILNAMTEITKLPSRGVRDIVNYSPLGWITGVQAESCLIEARFIDKDSITDADDYLDAYAIACGIADFLKVPRGKSVEQIAAETPAPVTPVNKCTQNMLNVLSRFRMGRTPTADELKAYVNIKTFDEVDAIFMASSAYKALPAQAKAGMNIAPYTTQAIRDNYIFPKPKTTILGAGLYEIIK